MPSYVITAPDGNRYRVTGSGTADEALAHFQSQWKPTNGQPKEQFSGILSDESMAQLVAEDSRKKANMAGAVARTEAAARAQVPTEGRPAGEVDPLTGRTRGEMETELANYHPSSPFTDRLLRGAREVTRVSGAGLTNLAKGVMWLPHLAEQAITRPTSAISGQNAEGPIGRLQRELSPAALAPQNRSEEVISTLQQGLGGVVGGGVLGETLQGGAAAANAVTGSTAKNVGNVLTSNYGAQVGGALTGGAAAETAKEAGANELVQMGASMLAPLAAPGAAAIVPGAAAVAERMAARAPNVKAPQVADNPVKAARALGYKVRPSDAAKAAPEEGRPIASAVERLSSSDDIRRGLLTSNQKITTSKAATDLGLPAESPRLTVKDFDKVRAAPLAKYREVGRTVGQFEPTREFSADLDNVSRGVGLHPDARAKIAQDVDQYRYTNMSGPDALKTVSVLRRRAAREIQSKDINTNDLGDAHRKIADAIESEIERRLGATGNAQLMDDFRNARQTLAKTHDVETATRSGQVDAAVLNKLQKRGAKLSGSLKEIADTYEMFPHVLKHPQTLSSVTGGSVQSFNPAIDVMSLGARPAARTLLKSDFYQNLLGRENPAPVKSAPTPKHPTQPPINRDKPLSFSATSDVPGPHNVAARAEAAKLAPRDLSLGEYYPNPEITPRENGIGPRMQESPRALLEREQARMGAVENGRAIKGSPRDIVENGERPPEIESIPWEPTNKLGDVYTNKEAYAPLQMLEAGKPRISDLTLADDLKPMESAAAPESGNVVVQPSTRAGYSTISVGGKKLMEVQSSLADELVNDLSPQHLVDADKTPAAQLNSARYKPEISAAGKKSTPQKGLTVLKNVTDQPVPDEFVMPGSTVIRAGSAESPEGFLAFAPDDDGAMVISRSTLKPEAQGKGTGKAMLLEAARQAQEAKVPLHSDKSVTVAQLRVYESLKNSGKLSFDYAVPQKVAEALEQGDPKTVVRAGGQPVIKNIRLLNVPR